MRTQLCVLLGACALVSGASAVRAGSDAVGEDAGETLPVSNASGSPSTTAESAQLQEVVVSAQRRSERLQDVPVSVSAFDQNAIAKLDISDIRDITRLTPGLDSTVSFGGQPVVSIRGIIWNVGAATTGIYIDDTPIQVRFVGQGETAGNAFPDLFDIDRIEVLRGPQGTLFGSGSEGGTIRFITPQPSLTQWEGHARAEMSFLQNGEPGSQFGIAGGGPIVDGELGFRVSAYIEQSAGWIDRAPYGVPGGQVDNNANSGNTQTLNAAMTWAPTQNLRITPSLYYQREYQADIGQYWPMLSDPSDNKFINGYIAPQPILDRFVLPALKVSWDLGGVSLYSNTSYMDRTRDITQDYSFYVTELLSGGIAPPVEPAPTYMKNPQQQFTQEIRLQSNDEASRLRWVVGGFFQRIAQQADQTIVSPNLGVLTQAFYGTTVEGAFGVPLMPGGVSYEGFDETVDKQEAIFGQADFKLTSHWTLTGGLRYAHTTFDHSNYQDGPINGGTSSATNGSSENDVLPKGGLSYKPSEDLMFYATVAKGFRPGGGNTPVPTSLCSGDLKTLGLTDAPPTYGSDHVWSYELGSKGDALARRLQWEASVFYIKWSEVQGSILLPSCGFNFIANLGEAVSKGFDLQLNLLLTDDLVLGATLGYTDAKYTTTVDGPNSTPIVSDGDRLQAAPWHGTLSLDYNVWKSQSGAVTYAHVDGQYTNGYMSGNPDNALYDPIMNKFHSNFFAMTRVGFKQKGWDVSLFVKNLTNSHSDLFDQHWVLTTPLVTSGTYTPRSIGVTVNYQLQ